MDGPGTLNAIELLVGLLGLAGARGDRRPAAAAAVHGRPRRRRPGRRRLATAVGVPAIEVTPELVLIALLPGLVFEAAYRLRLDELRRWLGGLVLLAVPGVLDLGGGRRDRPERGDRPPPDLAFLVGAMVSATDPAAVVATFKPLRVAPALADDGRRREPAQRRHRPGPVRDRGPGRRPADQPARCDASGFIGTVALSVAIGVATGWLATRLISLIDDHLLELTISVVLAYGSYLSPTSSASRASSRRSSRRSSSATSDRAGR